MNRILNRYSADIKNVAGKGLFHLFTANGLIYLVGFASQLIVAGLLDPADIGRIKIMQAYVGITSIGVGLGFNSSMIKRIAPLKNQDERAKILQLTLLMSISTFIIFYAILWALNYFHLISPDRVIVSLFPYYTLYLLPLGLQTMLIAWYQANKEIKKMSRLQFYAKICAVVMIVILTYLFGLRGYIISIPIGGIVIIVLLLLNLSSEVKISLFTSISFKKNDILSLWHLAKFVLLANLIGNLITSLDIYLVNYLIIDREMVGYYMFALTLVGVMNIFPATIQQIAFPYYAEKSANSTLWLNTFRKYNKINHVFLILMFLIVIGTIPVFVKVVFQGKYNQSLTMFPFLLIGWLMNYLNNMKGTALMGAGKFNLNMYSSLIILAFTLIFLLVLGHYFGLNGIIVAKVLSGVVAYIVSGIIFQRYSRQLGHYEIIKMGSQTNNLI